MAVDDKYQSYTHVVEVLRKGENRGTRFGYIVVEQLRTSDYCETRQVTLQVLREKADPLVGGQKTVVFVVSS
jgi:hypothetical protein